MNMWPHTYEDICTVYTAYVVKKYGKAIVVFDGYSGRSTKDMIHQRRSKGQTGLTVSFTEEMQLTMKKTTFLANTSNKQLFISMLGHQLEERGCKVHHASGFRPTHCAESSGICHST